MRIVLLVAWSLCLLSLVAAGVVCGRFLGVHESGLVETQAMVLAIMLMVAGLAVGVTATGFVYAFRMRPPAP